MKHKAIISKDKKIKTLINKISIVTSAALLVSTSLIADISDSSWGNIKAKVQINSEAYNNLGKALYASDVKIKDDNVNAWESSTIYAQAGNKVSYSQGSKNGVFVNSWWTKGDIPNFNDESGVWKIVKRVNIDGEVLEIKDTIEYWDSSIAYIGTKPVWHMVDGTPYCFKAKYWTKNNEPVLTTSVDIAEWKSPWKEDSTACESTKPAIAPPIGSSSGKSPIEKPPVVVTEKEPTVPDYTTVVPPVIPAPTPAPDRAEKPDAIVVSADIGLPSGGYEFLREVQARDWDWLFPLRSGKYNAEGGTRNKPPYALEDGSTDTFSLANFKKAVLEYNSWAKKNNYKEFLNEGTKKQQAQEFIVFWAKSSRETSGSWSTAKEPWIDTASNGNKIWKGGLYWVEEVGHETQSDGTSSYVAYVDSASNFKPASNRSYYGRGVIQLSWNYNYGAFSAWLYDNSLLSDVVTSRDTLLKRPDYVATNGTLSILSGIWFWMTPQGAKPSSHDVMYGDVYNVSTKTQDMGLPPRNDGGIVPAESGDTTSESVMAYRLGTVINIVNGGLECNRAAKWHAGPMQRVSYFNAYTKYFNDEMSGLNATKVTKATNVWNDKVSESSVDDLKTATCYSQKSYYGW